MTRPLDRRFWLLVLSAAAAVIVAACKSSPINPPVAPPPPAAQPAPTAAAVIPGPPASPIAMASNAATPRDYRRDAASHLYRQNQDRIYKGKMQPQLYAVGVLNVDIDGRGQVVSISWLRTPTHAPEVMADVTRMVRQAAPYPAPVRMGKVTYTETWLWDKSGRFQLDTLTEGQL
ncbi:MAG: hypothetical protein RIS34_2055 [Pseudomonadota bacterium]